MSPFLYVASLVPPLSLSLSWFLPVFSLSLVFRHNHKSLKHQSHQKLANDLDEDDDKVDDVPSVLEVVLPECNDLENAL